MAFWKVAGFSQPSPIEQILAKEEYTLEELLDEDDIIQECKSLNGRLIAFLREKKTVEQLLRYLIEPPNDPDDPKKQYRYPFTACEVFCCEVEAVFNTLLEDEELLQLLFSLLDQEPPLSCKAAGYFGRVVGQLLLRKTNEMMQHLSHNDEILEKLIRHVDTTSIADIIKRLVGADDHSSMIFSPMHTQWLAETPLVTMLLDRLGPEYTPHVQANAADILTAIAHTQPSALASQLMQQQSIDALFSRALQPGSRVLVTALDVCTALLEPRRALDPGVLGPGANGPTDNGIPMPGAVGTSSSSGIASPAAEAITGMLQYLPQLMEHMRNPGGSEEGSISARQETPYGVLTPPLGRARLRVVELVAALLRVGDDAVDAALIKARALPSLQELFVAYPFNNLLHHQLYAVLLAVLRQASPVMVSHVFDDCQLVSWLLGLPQEVTPTPRPGGTEVKAPLRAGYLGHVTRIGQVLQEAAAQQQEIADVLQGAAGWPEFLQQLAPQLEKEDVTRWQCGRPANTEGGELDSDGDEFPNDMDPLEQGMPPGMYHRYGVLDDDMEDEEDDGNEHTGDYSNSTGAVGSSDVDGGTNGSSGMYSADMLVAGMAGLGMHDPVEPSGTAGAAGAVGAGTGGGGPDDGTGSAGQVPAIGNWSLLAHPGASSSAVDIPGERLMEDDAVLLADDEDMGALTASTLHDSPPGALGASVAASPPIDDMVLVEDVDIMPSVSQSAQEAAGSQPAAGAGSSSSGGSSPDLASPPSAVDTPMVDAESAPATSAAVANASAASGGAAEAAPVVASHNPFAAASELPQPVNDEASTAGAEPAEDAAAAGPVAAEDAPAAADAAAAAAAVEKAPGELSGDVKGVIRDSSTKHQAMASHPVEVPEELS